MNFKLIILNPYDYEKKQQIAAFLLTHNLLYEQIDYTLYVEHEGAIITTGSKILNTIKCLLVHEKFQNQSLANLIIDKLVQQIYQENFNMVFVFTQSTNVLLFKSLNFHVLYQSIEVCLLTNRIDHYEQLKNQIASQKKQFWGQKIGAIVMNANPLTLGHEYLIKHALKSVDFLYVILVEEDRSEFTLYDRKKILELFCQQFLNVQILLSSPYIISAAIFNGYFLNCSSNLTVIQATIDCYFFNEIFIKNLGINYRFLGDEPISVATAIYNKTIKTNPDLKAIQVEIIPRLKTINNKIISASTVRKLIKENKINQLTDYLSIKTINYLRKINFATNAQRWMKKDR